jgi:hypothetical protein
MRRRTFLLAATAALRADPRQEIYDLFGSMANSLAEGNAVGFLQSFDPKMPGYQELAANVQALVQQAEVHSTIEIIEDSGDARERAVLLDWLLQLTEKQSSANAVRRQQTVKCRLVKPKRTWRVESFEPIGFLAPPKVRD